MPGRGTGVPPTRGRRGGGAARGTAARRTRSERDGPRGGGTVLFTATGEAIAADAAVPRGRELDGEGEDKFGKPTNETSKNETFFLTDVTSSTNKTSLKLLRHVSFVENVSFIEFYKWGACKLNPFLLGCQQMKQMKLFCSHKSYFVLITTVVHIFLIRRSFILDVVLTTQCTC